MGLLDNTTEQEYYNNNDHGNYQFVSLKDIVEQFMFVYVFRIQFNVVLSF